jgi:phosphate transport system substrate-binding protein
MKALAAAILCIACPALAQVEGAFTVTGSTSTAPYARAWAAAFGRAHPKAPVRVLPTSSSAAPAAMLENAATIGMMSRSMNEKERKTIADRHGQAPLEFRVALDAVGIYVRKDNPLPSITVAQIEQIFSAAPRAGARAETWGQLGVEGPLARVPIVAFGFDRGRGAYEVMRELALGGADFHSGVSTEPVSTSVVQGVGVEPGGIGYASVYYRTPRTRLLPVAPPGGEAVAPSEEAVRAGQYPLARFLYLYANASAPQAPRRFLQFVLSEEGQSLVRRAGGIPIEAALASSQTSLLR